MTAVDLGRFSIGSGRLLLIAGPCVIESEPHTLDLARTLRDIAARSRVDYVFKASYDKANRTSAASYRGPGLHDGLATLRRVRDEVGVPVLTDIHEPSHAAPVADVADILQIPAFLCRQTDLLTAAGQTGRVVNIKKGQFLSPLEVRHIIAKVTATGNERILVTERGTSFGYNNLVVDMRALPIMRTFGYPVIYDVTHSLQLPGAGNGVTAGQAEFIEPLACAGVAAGIDGIFMEVHDRPEVAKSDAQNALRLDRLEPLLSKLVRLHEIAHEDSSAREEAAATPARRNSAVTRRLTHNSNVSKP